MDFFKTCQARPQTLVLAKCLQYARRAPMRTRITLLGIVSEPASGWATSLLKDKRTSRKLQRVDCFQHRRRVPLGLHLAPLVSQHAIGVDQERAALDAKADLAVHVLFLDDIEQAA